MTRTKKTKKSQTKKDLANAQMARNAWVATNDDSA